MTEYTLTPQSARKIANAVDRINSLGMSGGEWHPHRPVESRRRTSPASSIVIGKTTAAWNKGTSATVDVWAGDPLADTGNTTEAMNLFADIEADKWVAMIGGYLISAEC